eukprot:2712113-Rhodomonas_salina.1
MQQIGQKLFSSEGGVSQSKVDQRELQTLVRLLETNRSLLCQSFVGKAEKKHNTPSQLKRGKACWHISMLTPLLKLRTTEQRMKQARSQLKKKQVCATCGSSSSKLKVCQQCRDASYCSRDCQVAGWKEHKK